MYYVCSVSPVKWLSCEGWHKFLQQKEIFVANIQSGKVPIITSFPDVLGETPVFANTRVPGGHLDVACAQAQAWRVLL
jgi:hypothetical protein